MLHFLSQAVRPYALKNPLHSAGGIVLVALVCKL